MSKAIQLDGFNVCEGDVVLYGDKCGIVNYCMEYQALFIVNVNEFKLLEMVARYRSTRWRRTLQRANWLATELDAAVAWRVDNQVITVIRR